LNGPAVGEPERDGRRKIEGGSTTKTCCGTGNRTPGANHDSQRTKVRIDGFSCIGWQWNTEFISRPNERRCGPVRQSIKKKQSGAYPDPGAKFNQTPTRTTWALNALHTQCILLKKTRAPQGMAAEAPSQRDYEKGFSNPKVNPFETV